MKSEQKNPKFKLNPFFKLTLDNKLRLDLLLDNVSLKLSHPNYVELLSEISSKKLVTKYEVVNIIKHSFDVSLSDAQNIFNNLQENKVIVNSSYVYPQLDGVKHWIKRGWLDALILHLKTSNLEFSDNKTINPDEYQNKILSNLIKKEGMPELWKNFSKFKEIKLKPATPLPKKKFQEILLERRSNNPWKKQKIKLPDLNNMLFYANSETRLLRTSLESDYLENPSLLLNSSFSSLETYLVVFNVQNLEQGIYHYNPKTHSLFCIKKGNFMKQMIKMCIGQDRLKGSSCAFVITSVWQRYMFRYRHPRAYRTLLINVAELAHKYILLGTTYGLSTFLTPAIEDDFADRLFGLHEYEEAPLYVVAIG